MISKKVADRINLQINRETFSAYLYMAMSARMSEDGYNGIAKWFMVQYHEEMFHSMKFFQYLLDQGAKPVMEKVDKPDVKAKTIKEFFEATLEHEKFVTASIRELLELAAVEKDYATENLVRWYINEQAEEEKNVNDILRNLELLGDGKQGVFMLNIEMGKRGVTIPLDYSVSFPAV